MLELSEEGLRVVEALLRAPVAWQSPAEIARSMGLDLEETTDLLAALDADGWLSAWDRELEVVVTLSVEAASRLRVRLVEFGHDEVPRWARIGDPEPPWPRASGVFRGELAAGLELIVDATLSAEEAVERAEEALARWVIPSDPRNRAFVEGLPGPTLLLGTGLSPWPGPGEGRKTSCPSCGSRCLKPSMYCLYCDRWGLDHLLMSEQAPRARTPLEPKDESDRRDFERRARKDKRRNRRLVQSEAVSTPKRRPRRALP